jgi:3-hydroxy-9,10-secoandrosta-1,3,5(10)-triene-9,17-dione monooxygenase reductase component
MIADVAPAEFRRVLGHLPTGVALVTGHGDDGPLGMAVNSITSVSLAPPLLLICPAKTSWTWAQLRRSGAFCINVMAGHHEDVTRAFAQKGVDRFGGVPCTTRTTGPALDDAVAWIECRIREEHEAGDHTIVVADVLAVEAVDGRAPLVFHRGRYGTFLHR